MSAKKSAEKRPVLQWIMAVVGACVTASAVGLMAWEGVRPSAPPMLSARIVEVETTAAGHVAKIKVKNDGDDTAAAVNIAAVLGDQAATATLDYVPGHGDAEAYVRFDADPRRAVVRVEGWAAP